MTKYQPPKSVKWGKLGLDTKYHTQSVMLCGVHWEWLRHAQLANQYPSRNATLRMVVDAAMRADPSFRANVPPLTVDRGRRRE